MKVIAVLLIVLLALTTSPASADKLDSSANYFLPRCRAVVNHDSNKLLDVGVCSGAMVALHDTPILLHVPLITRFGRARRIASLSNNQL